MSNRDTRYQDYAICPHCGYENVASYELGSNHNDDSGEVDCGECGKGIVWERHVSYSYSTRKARAAEPEKGDSNA